MILYFGEPWDAPIFGADVSQEVSTPVGEGCRYCTEEIVEGDRGHMQVALMATTRDGEHIGARYTSLPIHRECQLRAVLGGLDHVEGRCEYTGHCNDLREAAGRSLREDALAVWDWAQRKAGRSPED